MSRDDLKIKIIEKSTKEILWESDIDNVKEAYKEASFFEKMGIEIELIRPTLSEELVSTLGLSTEDRELYEKSLFDEIHDHEGSCCAKEEDEKN